MVCPIFDPPIIGGTLIPRFLENVVTILLTRRVILGRMCGTGLKKPFVHASACFEKGKPMRCNMFRILMCVAVACASVFASSASAAIYTIDPTQSSLQVSVFASGVPLTQAQFTGSDVTSLSGTLDVVIGGGNLTVNSTPSSVTFANQANPVAPGPGGGVPTPGTVNALPDLPAAGLGVGNYGFELIVPGDPSDPSQWLNLDTAGIVGYADISAALASLAGTVAISGGVFSPNGLTVSTDAGALDYNLNQGNGDGPPQTSSPFINGTTGIGGNSGVVAGAPNGSVIGNTLIIPIFVDVPVNTGLFIVDAVFSGTIVATTAVPEPSSIALAGLGLVALIPVIRRRLRKA